MGFWVGAVVGVEGSGLRVSGLGFRVCGVGLGFVAWLHQRRWFRPFSASLPACGTLSRWRPKYPKLFYFEHPSRYSNTLGLGTVGHSGVALQGDSGAGHSGDRHSRETLGLGLWGWALEGDSGIGHSKETLGLGILGTGTLGRVFGWALQGDSGVGDWGWAP